MKNFYRLFLVLFVLVLACNEDDAPPTPTTSDQAIMLSERQPVTVTFGETIDTLFYTLTVSTPAVIEVSVDDNPSGISMTLLGQDKKPIEDFLLREDRMIEYGPVAAGIYYLELDDVLSSNSEQTFSLTYSLDDSDKHELNNAEGESALIELDKSYKAYLRDKNDVDYFQFTLAEPAFVEVLVDSFPKALTNMKVALLGAPASFSDTGYDGEAITLKTSSLPAGDYRLLFSSSTGVSSTNPYVFTVKATEVEGVVGNTTYDAAYALKSGDEITTLMEVEEGDKFFKLEVNECGVIDVTIDPVPNGLDFRAYIHDQKGQEASYGSYSRNGKEGEPIYLSYGPVSSDKPYYLRIREDRGRISNETFKVRYSLDTADRYECNDTPELAEQNNAPIVSDTEYEAYIRTGSDTDWYRFEMDSAGIVTVELKTPSDIEKMVVTVFEDGSENIRVDYSEVKAGQTGRVVAGPLAAGTHYLRFNSWEYSYNKVGQQSRDPYRFTLSLDYDKYEFNNTFEQASDITDIIDKEAITGYILAQNAYGYKFRTDVDFYKFTVKETTTFQISATALNTSDFTYLELYDKPNDNSEITTDSYSDRYGNNQETIQRTLTLEPNEYYYIKLYNRTTSTEPYQLSIKTVQ